jgi:hypothetical protein
MLSAKPLQITDRSPYRVIRTRQDYLRYLNLRRLKARTQPHAILCLKLVPTTEVVHESR